MADGPVPRLAAVAEEISPRYCSSASGRSSFGRVWGCFKRRAGDVWQEEDGGTAPGGGRGVAEIRVEERAQPDRRPRRPRPARNRPAGRARSPAGRAPGADRRKTGANWPSGSGQSSAARHCAPRSKGVRGLEQRCGRGRPVRGAICVVMAGWPRLLLPCRGRWPSAQRENGWGRGRGAAFGEPKNWPRPPDTWGNYSASAGTLRFARAPSVTQPSAAGATFPLQGRRGGGKRPASAACLIPPPLAGMLPRPAPASLKARV